MGTRSLSNLMSIMVLAFAMMVAIGSAGASNGRDGTWSSIPAPPPAPPGDSIPSARLSMGAAYDSHRNQMIIFGGTPTYRNDAWTLSLGPHGHWIELEPAGVKPAPRHGAGAVYDVAGDRFIVFGGYDGNFHNDAWSLSLGASPVWTPLSPTGTPPPARAFNSTVYDAAGNRLIVFGGYDGFAFRNDVWALSLGAAPAWTQLSPAGPAPPVRDLSQGIYDPVSNRLVIFGGWNGAYLSDTWALSLGSSPAWSVIPAAAAPSARREFSPVYDGARNRMVIFGGTSGGISGPFVYYSDAWALNLTGSPAWQLVDPGTSVVTARFGHQSVYDPILDRLATFGGYDGSYLQQTAFLSFSAPTGWTEYTLPSPPDAAAPSPRREYSAAIDPDHRQMIVFSGTTLTLFDDDQTWAFALSGDPVWSRLHTPVAPHPRHGSTSIWDPLRHRMILFGGYDQTLSQYANDTWQLTTGPGPAWAELVTTGVRPDGRLSHGAIYDPLRDRMLVFGGLNFASLADLWELPLSGPNALQWHSIAAAGTPPSPRWGMSMTYDPLGDRAVVFGGNAAGPRDETFALDLSNGTPAWSRLATGGPNPTPRYLHTTVYDSAGQRLVLYGGFNLNSGFLGDVWELRLGAHARWNKLRPDGLSPGERDLMTAVYDAGGDRLAVFGGYRDSQRMFFGDTQFLTWGAGSKPTYRVEDGASRPVLPAAVAPRFELTRIQPNPAPSTFTVEFSLPVTATAQLDLVDLSGRVVDARILDSLGGGVHRVEMGRGLHLPIGVYFLRLRQAAKVQVRRISVVR